MSLELSKALLISLPGRFVQSNTISTSQGHIQLHCSYPEKILIFKYPPLSIARYSSIQLSEVEQCRLNNLAQGLKQQAAKRVQYLNCSDESMLLSTHYATAPHYVVYLLLRMFGLQEVPLRSSTARSACFEKGALAAS